MIGKVAVLIFAKHKHGKSDDPDHGKEQLWSWHHHSSTHTMGMIKIIINHLASSCLDDVDVSIDQSASGRLNSYQDDDDDDEDADDDDDDDDDDDEDDLGENESFDSCHEESDKEADEEVGQDGQKHF